MDEFSLKLSFDFTKEDKEACKPTINKIVKLAELTRQSGVAEWKKEFENDSSKFLKIAICLTGQGMNPVIIDEILQNIIIADGCSGFELLDKILIYEGIKAIRTGENPQFVEWILLSLLGEEFLPYDEIINGFG